MQVRNIIAWVLQVVVALAFLKAGSDKLLHLDGTMQMFSGLGLPGWFGGFIGAAEVLGAIGLLVPRTTRLAALGLIIILLGALTMHATKIPGGIGGGAFAGGLLVMLIIISILRRPAATPVASEGVIL